MDDPISALHPLADFFLLHPFSSSDSYCSLDSFHDKSCVHVLQLFNRKKSGADHSSFLFDGVLSNDVPLDSFYSQYRHCVRQLFNETPLK